MAIKRLHYFTGQFLKEPDFTDEQKYHLDMRRRHHQHLHTAGIAYGLEVTAGTNAVTVTPGMAIDPQGQEIILETQQNLPITAAPVDIVISYDQRETDETSETGITGNTRWEEIAVLAAVPPGSVDSARHVVLARVTGVSPVALDGDYKRPYSAPTVMGDLAVKRDLTVEGNLSVQGRTTVVDTQEMRGNVQLGDAPTDTVTIVGILNGPVAGRLEIGSPVDIAGDLTLTGPVTLPANPTANLHAAPKQYVDTKVAKAGDTMEGSLSITAPGTGLSVTGDVKVGGNLAVGGVLSASLGPNTVGTTQIADNAVTGAKILDGSVGTTKLPDSAVPEIKIANNAVSANKLRADATVDANRAVMTNHIRDLAVTEPKLATGSVSNRTIQDNSITAAKILDGSVGTAELANGSVTLAKLDAGAGRGMLRAFLSYVGGSGTIMNSLNVASVSRIGVGQYDINWSVATNAVGPFVAWTWGGNSVRGRGSGSMLLQINVVNSAGALVDDHVMIMVAM